MALLFLTLGFSLTGYLLPWDQKGYWATKVATNIMGGAPVVGPYLQKIVVGGPDYGNQTVTRFYGLHVGFLPALARAVPGRPTSRCSGGTASRRPPDADERPDRHVLARAALHGHGLQRRGPGRRDRRWCWPRAAPTSTPRPTPSSSDYPARPEWYFLSLFQMLKLFPGSREIIGTIVIPTALVVVMLLLPFLDRVLPRKLAHFLACGFVFAVVGGAGYLTVQAMRDDAATSVFQEARKKADAARQRALYLAGLPDVGIPPDGAAYILRRDPLTQGRSVLERRCLGCHVFEGKGTGTQTASDLAGFRLARLGSRPAREPGIADLLRQGRQVRRHGRMEEELEARAAKSSTTWPISSRRSPRFPTDMTPDDWLNSPGRRRPSGARAVPEGVRHVPRRSRA